MLLCWSLLLCCASLVFSLPRLDGNEADVIPPDDAVASLLKPREARAVRSRTSNIYWVYPHLAPSKNAGGDPPSKVFNIRRWRRSFPSTDDVSDTDVAQWTRKNPPKTEFITSHRSEKGDDADPKTNEVEPSNKSRTINSRMDPGEPFYRPPHRRIIYYANLPEINSRDRTNDYGQYYRRYEPLPQASKYPRESSYEGRARSHPLSFERPYDRPYDRSYDRFYDRYPGYRQAGASPSYTIVDAEAPRSNSFDSASKYNRIPSPYRQGEYPVRPREPLGSQGATLVRNEPYRDYNPRQPAPWSVQIGTKLTVKDDERGFRPDVGQRRFYVNSQEPPRFNRIDRSRYNYAT